MPRNANQSKQSNYSMYIDVGGSSNNIDTNYYLPSGTNPKSISFWLKNVDPNGWITTGYQYTVHGGALSTGQGFGVGVIGSSSGAYIWFIGHSTADYFIPSSATGTMTTNVWYHIVVTYDNTRTNNLHFYLDGVKIDETNKSLNTSSANSVKIGASATGGGGSGAQYVYINQVCFFDYTLTNDQITTLWGGGTSVSNPMALPIPPKAYYPLGTSAWDGNFLAENNAIGDYVFDFNPSNSNKINLGNIFPTNSDMSVGVWFKYTGTVSTNDMIIGARPTDNDRNYLTLQDQGTNSRRLDAVIRRNGQSAIEAQKEDILPDVWHHAVYTISISGSTKTLKLYVNGNLEATSSGTLGDTPAGSVYLGWMEQRNAYGGPMKTSNAQIWTSKLEDSEVTTLYNNGSPIRTLANIPQNSNLKAWYKLDASEVYNSTSTEWSVDNNKYPSAYPSSLNFDAASSDYIQTTFNPNTSIGDNNSWTMSSWIYVSDVTTQQRILGSYFSQGSQQRFFVGIINGGILFGYGNKAQYPISGTSVSTNSWQNIIVTYSTTTGIISAYVNGSLNGTYDYAGNGGDKIMNSLNITIGDSIGDSAPLNGSISNASIWNTALTPAQVTEIYNNGTPSNLSSHSATSNLVSWWKLNNTTTGIQDSKGSNNGTNNGATEYPGFVNSLAGESSGMTQANLVQSDLQTVAPYSKYAMNFDAASSDYVDCGNVLDNIFTGSDFSVSTWIYATTNTTYNNFFNKATTVQFYLHSNKIKIYLGSSSSGIWPLESTATLSLNTWYNIIFTRSGNENKLYINASLDNSATSTSSIPSSTGSLTLSSYLGSSYFWDGSISNPSVWNTALSQAQVTEIYNEGLPSNLNSHSAYSNLVSWWQLGENSSFTNNWICADEKGSNNGTSANMGVDALTNGVGTTANGVSTSMAVGALVGNAPYSDANAISSGMAVTARVTGSGNTP